MTGAYISIRKERHGDILRESLKELAQVPLHLIRIKILYAPFRMSLTGT